MKRKEVVKDGIRQGKGVGKKKKMAGRKKTKKKKQKTGLQTSKEDGWKEKMARVDDRRKRKWKIERIGRGWLDKEKGRRMEEG